MARVGTALSGESIVSRKVLKLGAALFMAGTLAACNATVSTQSAGFSAAPIKPAAQSSTSSAEIQNFKLGKPYQIAGRWFHPKDEPGYDEVGAASWYGSDFHGRQTANGETYDMNALTAAHPTLPMPSYARVTNIENNRSVVVRINDRGPFTHGRLIDLSRQTARLLDFKQNGTANVRVQYLGPASPQSDDGWLTTTVRHNGNPVAPDTMAATGPAELPDPASTAGREQAEPDEPSLALASSYALAGGRDVIAATFALFDNGAAASGQIDPAGVPFR